MHRFPLVCIALEETVDLSAVQELVFTMSLPCYQLFPPIKQSLFVLTDPHRVIGDITQPFVGNHVGRQHDIGTNGPAIDAPPSWPVLPC